MKTKKLLALLMAGTMSVSMLSGCGGSAAKTDDSSADAADTSASAESDVFCVYVLPGICSYIN